LNEDKNFIYIQADTTEEVFAAIETSVNRIRKQDKNRLCAIVWDSVAATSSRAEMEGAVGDSTIGLQARLIGQGLRKIIRFVGENRICLVFLNQVRMKIGGIIFGSPYTTSGGKAIPFFSSVRLSLFSAGKLKAGSDVIGAGIKAKIIKNRMGPPHRETTFNMYFNKGIVEEEAWLKYLLDYKIAKTISTQKSSIDFNGEAIEFKNRDFADLLNKNTELRDFCIKSIKQRLYVEQDPSKRDEEIVLEELAFDEEL